MNQKLILRRSALSVAVALSMALPSCQDDLSEDSHYKSPSFLVGNAIEVLQKDGNYKSFLKGIELIGYNDVVDSQILTVLAPTDEAFAQFLQEKGYASIEEMYQKDPEYTRLLITYHLLYYAMDWEKMTNFRPTEGDAATQLEKNKFAGIYNRFRTRSAVATERLKNVDVKIDEDSLEIVHYDRYVTVFSEKMFKTLGIDAATNYNYFFPNTTWNPNHLANGFNVMNAAVLDTAAVVTDNGYLYHIDHVIEPVGSIYEELTSNSDYSIIKSLYDVYSYFGKDEIESENRGYNVYARLFRDLPNIASEWPTTDYLKFSANTSQSWNLFVPTNQALDRMFTEYWDEQSGYHNVMDLNPLIQRILLKEGLGKVFLQISDKTDYADYTCFPDYIRQQKTQSYYGNDITTDPATYDVNVFCNNGVIYGSSKMNLPGVFSSVAGPAFKDVKYLPYLYALDGSGLMLNLASLQTDFVTLIPDTAQFTHHEPTMRLFQDVTATTPTYRLQEWNDQESDYSNVSSSTMTKMVNMNTTTAVKELKKSGVQVIETNEAFNYWFVRDGKITTNSIFNEQLKPSFDGNVWSEFYEITSSTSGAKWSNGHAYAYDYSSVFMPASGTTLEEELSQNVDRDYPYSCFVQLLQKSGLVKEGAFVNTGANTIRLLAEGCRFFVMIPTNEAIKANLANIPGCNKLTIDENTYVISGTVANKSLLQNALLNYFVTYDRAPFNAYPYIGSTCKGEFQTAGAHNLVITDDGNKLSVSLVQRPESTSDAPEGNVVNVIDKYNGLPFVFSDGAFQLIDEVLK